MTLTMRKYPTLTEAKREARGYAQEAAANGDLGRAFVLRPDGYTDCYSYRDGAVTHKRTAGHTTMGLHIDPSDLPCVVYP